MESQKTQPNETQISVQADESVQQDHVQLTDFYEARLSRVRDYLKDSLAKENALEAILGSMNSSIMQTDLQVEGFLEHAMSNGPKTLEYLNQFLPAIETRLKLVRQAERLAQVQLRISQAANPQETNSISATLNLEMTAANSEESSDLEHAESEDIEV